MCQMCVCFRDRRTHPVRQNGSKNDHDKTNRPASGSKTEHDNRCLHVISRPSPSQAAELTSVHELLDDSLSTSQPRWSVKPHSNIAASTQYSRSSRWWRHKTYTPVEMEKVVLDYFPMSPNRLAEAEQDMHHQTNCRNKEKRWLQSPQEQCTHVSTRWRWFGV
ncbi:unnamed protein product [Vitrella brassicaformis CCMP3155]|uniref:Uncharacterized protein n=1 Tax=Vitrella brassicaformis (strain CCMP3155) TaxID=1169540 RepID=A0A0G4EBC9_VITBC|nr:unnamed protein product [Vitrella brassicaformis CCMP3155]|eukprot:CEL93260.1 unnamed protein product [Vitrella brassicaformis CCMP3155]